MSLVQTTQVLAKDLAALHFGPPVACVYNPLDYAWDLHRAWLERFGGGRKEVLLVGMNPGPFGMVQTGVPFGEIEAVRSWLGLRGEVRHPAQEHAKRPVLGFACTRTEVSGKRMWGWAASRFVTPMRFAQRFFVHNYCPLAFVADSGANLTPDKLPKADTAPLFRLCDRMLRQVVELQRPRWVIGVGAFAEQRIRLALAGAASATTGGTAANALAPSVQIGRIPHPSPASPAANLGWERLVDDAFRSLRITTA